MEDPQNPLRDYEAQGVSVHTGFPNAAADRRLKSLDLNQLLIAQPTSTFMFRVRGDQGVACGIFDGDVAIVDRALSPRTSDLVLWHDGQRFVLSHQARLTPDVTLWGVVTATIHKHRS